MPELPEVEVVRRGLMPHLKGKTITGFGHSGKSLRVPIPVEKLDSKLPGSTIITVKRRAKYLLFPTQRGDLLIIHLGMTGRLALFNKNSPIAKHDHLFFQLDNNKELRYNDTRRFGAVYLISNYSAIDLENTFFSTSGPEPFSDVCTSKYFKAKAKGSSQAVKTFIMNSKVVVGIGNIYANESLFAAKIHPQTPAGRITHRQWQILVEKIREILRWAIDCGGSTISDFLNAGGDQGYFQINFSVYNQHGKPCLLCGTPIEKRAINGRASYFCPQCQKKG